MYLLLTVFLNSSGEEEDPGGGDPLSTRGLCAVGLLCCPRQGQCLFFFLSVYESVHHLYGFIPGLLIFTVQFARPGGNALAHGRSLIYLVMIFLTAFACKGITQ